MADIAMNRQARDRVGELVSAAETLRPDRALSLAVEAISAISGRGFVVAFERASRGRRGAVSAALDGQGLPPDTSIAPRWVIDIEAVPERQRNCWIEPMHAGIHGPDYFAADHPLHTRLGWRHPDYGRVMVCHGGALVAWAGLFVDERHPFREDERGALRELAQRISPALRIAALCAQAPAPLELSPRQRQIVDRIARGRTNKQIAQDLGIAPSTVKTIVERLFRLSGATNRAALAALARR